MYQESHIVNDIHMHGILPGWGEGGVGSIKLQIKKKNSK